MESTCGYFRSGRGEGQVDRDYTDITNEAPFAVASKVRCTREIGRLAMTPRQQFEKCLAKYEPRIVAIAKKALTKLRKMAPGANEMVYDNYNALVVGFVPGDRPSDVVFSIALYPNYLNLFFMWGKGLPDPSKRLQGSGKQIRGMRLDSAATLDEPEVRDLIRAAIERAKVPFDAKHKGRMEIRALVKKQRPRRPKKK
jgi:hypothetical protein